MDDICFICEKPFSDGDTVKVERGLQTLRNASIGRNDGHIAYLQTVACVTVHSRCRLNYTRKKTIQAVNRLEDEIPSTSSQTPPKVLRRTAFTFQNHCLFCATEANEAAETKEAVERRTKISYVRSNEFRTTLFTIAATRNDELSTVVCNRIEDVDLVEVRAKYHTTCYDKFRRYIVPANEAINAKIEKAMTEIYAYIEASDDSQFTLDELKQSLSDYIPVNTTILKRLAEHYSARVLITQKKHCSPIISFRDTDGPFDPDERLRIIDAAAAIVAQDICSLITTPDSYPPAHQMFEAINDEIPASLVRFIQGVLSRRRTGNTKNVERKCTAISHAIMAARRPRSFKSKLLIIIIILYRIVLM